MDKKSIEGAQGLYPASYGQEVTARESRRIAADHMVTAEEYISALHYPDSVCYSYYPIDLHTMKENEPLQSQYLEKGKVPEI